MEALTLLGMQYFLCKNSFNFYGTLRKRLHSQHWERRRSLRSHEAGMPGCPRRDHGSNPCGPRVEGNDLVQWTSFGAVAFEHDFHIKFFPFLLCFYSLTLILENWKVGVVCNLISQSSSCRLWKTPRLLQKSLILPPLWAARMWIQTMQKACEHSRNPTSRLINTNSHQHIHHTHVHTKTGRQAAAPMSEDWNKTNHSNQASTPML